MSTATLASPSQRLARYVSGRRAGPSRRFVVEVDFGPYLEAHRPARPPVELPAAWPLLLALVPTVLACSGALAFLVSTNAVGQMRELALLVAWLLAVPALPLSLVTAPIPFLVRRGGAPGYLLGSAGPGLVLLGGLLVGLSVVLGNALLFAGAATLLVSPLAAFGGLATLLHHRRTVSLYPQ